MKITAKWLEEKGACRSGLSWFLTQKETAPNQLIKILMAENHFDWANWLITRCITKMQNIRYAIYAAEQALHIYEDKYDDKRPQKAIAAAKKYLKAPSNAAANAANAAADAAANAAAYAAANAAAANAAAKEKIIKYGVKLLKEGNKRLDG